MKKNAIRFPNISRLARIVLAIPATSAPTERIFSRANSVITKLRTSLTAENAATSIFLKGNLNWFEKNQSEKALNNDGNNEADNKD